MARLTLRGMLAAMSEPSFQVEWFRSSGDFGRYYAIKTKAEVDRLVRQLQIDMPDAEIVVSGEL